MKKWFSCLIIYVCVVYGFSQEIIQTHIYRNDGVVNYIPQVSIDSIRFSKYDLNGSLFDYWKSQIVYTKDREYHIPLSVIDSIQFNMPKREVMDYYYSIMNLSEDSEWDSLLVTSNGYYAAMSTDSNQIITIAVDAINSVEKDQSVFAQLNADLLPINIMVGDKVYSFINYQDHTVDVLVIENDNTQLLEGVRFDYGQQSHSTRTGGISQNRYAEVVSRINSALTIVRGGSEGAVEATMAGLEMVTNNGSTAETDLVLSLSGISLGAGVALLNPTVSVPAVIVGSIVGGGISLWKYIEDKFNEDKSKKYKILAGQCEVETLKPEMVNNTSYRIGVKVKNASSIPAAYRGLNTYGLILKKVPMSEPNIGLNLYQNDVEVVYHERISDDGDYYVLLSDLDPGYKYFYRAFVLPYVERLKYEVNTGSAGASYAYYGASEVFKISNAVIKGYEQVTSTYEDGKYSFIANVTAELNKVKLMAVTGWGISLYRDGKLYKDYSLSLDEMCATAEIEFESEEAYLTWDEENKIFSTKDHWTIGTYIVFSADGYTGRQYSETSIILDLKYKKNGESCPDANHVHAVDLGLSVKWACCNVGASVPEGYGGYYAWGETEEKSDYDWDTYKYYSDNTGIVNIGSNISGTQYDVAHVKWGGSWRMPTLEEIKELVNNCTWKWTTYNGVNGQLVTGPNGNSIFLPAAGFRCGTDLIGRGSGGYYWSATLREYGSLTAYGLYFNVGLYWNYGWYRGYGHTVRPVTD